MATTTPTILVNVTSASDAQENTFGLAASLNNSGIDSKAAVDALEANHLDVNIYPFVFVIFYMIVGFIGNGIVFYIFTWQWKVTKTTVFILTLAGVDLFSCVFNMPVEAAILWHPIDFDYDVICKISRFTTFSVSAGSSFVLIAISVDRYLMICRPFLGRELGVRYAKRTCVGAVLLGILSTWPSLIFYGTFTNTESVTDPVSGQLVEVETKTCLVSNFYVEHYKLPAGFYFFLFGAHVIMFVILTMMYILIGRKLFISTDVGVTNEKRHSLKYIGKSMMSAITGSVPSTPVDTRDSRSLCDRSSRAVSLENVNRLDNTSLLNYYCNGRMSTPRSSGDIKVNILTDSQVLKDKCNNIRSSTELTPNNIRSSTEITPNSDPDCGSTRQINKGFETCDSDAEGTCKVDQDQQMTVARQPPPAIQMNNVDISKSSPTKPCNLKLDIQRRNMDGCADKMTSLTTPTLKTPSTSSSDKCLIQNVQKMPMTPESARGILYRSQSVESRARLNRILSDESRCTDVKEFSLRRNTVILRMVTIAFIISFLPYLVLVTLRYSDPTIPQTLSRSKQIVYHCFLRSYFINSMINPFIYGFMNVEFRSKLRSIFCKLCS